jgi:mRNA interferase RelE/StbE
VTPPYSVSLSTAAARQLVQLDATARRRVGAAIDLLAANPRPPGATPLVGGDGAWRVRTGDYRIIYEITDRTLHVWVIAVGHRREVYR